MQYKRIRDLREDKDISQKEMGAMLGVGQTTYSRYETGVLDIPIQSLIQLALFYETSIDYLVELTDESKAYVRKVDAFGSTFS